MSGVLVAFGESIVYGAGFVMWTSHILAFWG